MRREHYHLLTHCQWVRMRMVGERRAVDRERTGRVRHRCVRDAGRRGRVRLRVRRVGRMLRDAVHEAGRRRAVRGVARRVRCARERARVGTGGALGAAIRRVGVSYVGWRTGSVLPFLIVHRPRIALSTTGWCVTVLWRTKRGRLFDGVCGVGEEDLHPLWRGVYPRVWNVRAGRPVFGRRVSQRRRLETS